MNISLPLGLCVSTATSETSDSKTSDADADADVLYVVDATSRRVVCVAADDIDGDSVPVTPPLSDPRAVFAIGNTIWVAEAAAGVVSCWRDGTKLYETSGVEMRQPSGVCVADSVVFVAARDDHCVMLFNADDGSFIKRLGEKGDAPGQFRRFDCLCNGESGSIFVSDFGNNRIQEISWRDERVLSVFGAETLDRPQGVAFHNNKCVAVCDKGSRSVILFEHNNDSDDNESNESSTWRARRLDTPAKMPFAAVFKDNGSSLLVSCLRTGKIFSVASLIEKPDR